MRREKISAGALVWPALTETISRSGRLARVLCVMTICLFASLAHAQTHYVNQSGSDSNPGTADAPFRTINGALSIIGTAPGAGAGKTVEVAGGTYNEGLLFNLPSGVSWNQPFTLRARPGDAVTVRTDYLVNMFIADDLAYYSVIDGFVFDGANTGQNQVTIGNCCYGQPRFLRFQNNEFVNNPYGGFFVGGSNIEVVNNKMHGGFQEFSGCGQIHCFNYAFYVTGSNNYFSGNEVYDVASWVVHIYKNDNQDGGPQNNTVEGNTIHDFGFGDDRADGILLSSGSGNQANNNIIYNGSRGIALSRGCDGCVISNNTISNMSVCLEVSDSSNSIVQNNSLNNCAVNYISN